MPVMRPGRRTGAIWTTFVVLAILLAGCTGGSKSSQGLSPSGGAPSSPKPPPATCPLSGLRPHSGQVPNRPALAVKVENLPAARPQTGLSWADIVYEEPVEANITRFIAVYQCQDASRIEPVRSGRLTDPDILVQFGRPVFAYAGAVPQVIEKVRARGLIDVNFNVAGGAYHRDPARLAPHNLYTSTQELYAAAHTSLGAPNPVFAYSTKVPAIAQPAGGVHIPFSAYADVYWRWGGTKWLRWHGTVPHTLSDGTQVSARNVVVQIVKVVQTDIVDANGVRSPEVVSVGSGVAYVFRNGQVIKGTWSRPKLSDVTRFLDSSGNVVPLQPGATWVELVPSNIPVTILSPK